MLDLDTTARSQLHCNGLPIDDIRIFFAMVENTEAQPYLCLFICTSLSFSATPVVSLSPASTLSCIKRKYGHHLTHAEEMAADKLVLTKLMEACHVWDAMKCMAK